jgi:hypothetical protein
MAINTDDRLNILELVARYNWAIDHREAEAFADVFTADGELWADHALRAKGRAALIEHIRKAERTGHRIRHWPCNPVLEGTGDGAKLRMYVMAFDIGAGIRPQIIAEYEDDLARNGGQWKFRVRRVTRTAGDWPVHVAQRSA